MLIKYSQVYKNDIENIYLFTLEKFGRKKLLEIDKSIIEIESTVFHFPDIGRISSEDSKIRKFKIRKYPLVIIYKYTKTSLTLLRMKHEKRI